MIVVGVVARGERAGAAPPSRLCSRNESAHFRRLAHRMRSLLCSRYMQCPSCVQLHAAPALATRRQ